MRINRNPPVQASERKPSRWLARDTGSGGHEIYRETYMGAEVVAVAYTGKGTEMICEAMNIYDGLQEKKTFETPMRLRIRRPQEPRE